MQETAEVRLPKDGRHLRSERSRAVIARAMLERVRNTGIMPTTDAVAESAGVSRRSVFRHYSDVSELMTAAYELQLQDTHSRFPARDLSAGRGTERLAAFIDWTCERHEDVRAIRRAAVQMAHDYPALVEMMRRDDQQQRARVVELFGSLVPQDAQYETSISALVSASCWSYWDFLRESQGLEPSAAVEVVRVLMAGVLGATQNAAPGRDASAPA